MHTKYGVLVDGEFEERKTETMEAKGFTFPLFGRANTYDHYVMKEINRSYGKLDVEGRVVLDIGANIGCFSAWALQHKAMYVISLEPEVNNFNMLRLNTSPYGVDLPEEPYTLHNKALHSTDNGADVLYLAKSGKNPGNSSTTPRRGRVETPIEMMSVPQLKQYHPIIDVMKIDCEGAEYEFMPTLLDHYPDVRQIALEIHISGFGLEKAIALDNLMTAAGFKPLVAPKLDNDGLWQTLATYTR